MVEFLILGTCGGMPMPNRYLAAGILSYLGRKILIDCGEGTQVSMREHKTGFKSIDIICITHCHGDHVVGLPGLLSTIGNSERVEPLTIIGPKGIKEVVNGLNVINPYLPYEINIIESDNESNIINLSVDKNGIKVLGEEEGNVILKTFKLDHSAECIGYSFYYKRNPKFDIDKAIKNNVPKKIWSKLQKGEDIEVCGVKYTKDMVLCGTRKGIKVSYVTDTRPIESIKDFIKDSNLFVCEGTYGDEFDIEKAIKNKHMTFKEAANLAKESKAQKLILTHFSTALNSPEEFLSNAKEVFMNSYIGEVGALEKINFKDEV